MGHCEMLLAVAGLDKTALDERTRRLASGDWSSFPPGDRAALLLRPETSQGTLVDQHRRTCNRLIDHFGPERTLDILLVGMPLPLHDTGRRRFSDSPGARNVFEQSPRPNEKTK